MEQQEADHSDNLEAEHLQAQTIIDDTAVDNNPLPLDQA